MGREARAVILYHVDTEEERNIDMDFIVDAYINSRFCGQFAKHSIGLTIFIGDQEEGLSCHYVSGDPDFFKLVEMVHVALREKPPKKEKEMEGMKF